MDLDDLEPRKTPEHQLGMDLSKLSENELKTLVVRLKEEIERVEVAISDKQSSRLDADAIFKSLISSPGCFGKFWPRPVSLVFYDRWLIGKIGNLPSTLTLS